MGAGGRGGLPITGAVGSVGAAVAVSNAGRVWRPALLGDGLGAEGIACVTSPGGGGARACLQVVHQRAVVDGVAVGEDAEGEVVGVAVAAPKVAAIDDVAEAVGRDAEEAEAG